MRLSVNDPAGREYLAYLNGRPVDAVYADEEGHVVEIIVKDMDGQPISLPDSSGELGVVTAMAHGEVELRRIS